MPGPNVSSKPPAGSTIGLIINPIRLTGTARTQLQRVRAVTFRHGWQVLVRYTTPARTGEELARELISRGVAGIIVAGGDGTLSAVANGCLLAGGQLRERAGVFISPLALGAANLLARAVVRTELIDVGLVHVRRGAAEFVRVFLTVAGVGNSARVLAGHTHQRSFLRWLMPTVLRAGGIGWVGYLAAGIANSTRPGATYAIDGKQRSAWSIEYGNIAGIARKSRGHPCPQRILTVFPQAGLSTGSLAELVFTPRLWSDWWAGAAVGTGLLPQHRALRYRTITNAQITGPGLIHMDGEVYGRCESLEITCLPKALPVVPIAELLGVYEDRA